MEQAEPSYIIFESLKIRICMVRNTVESTGNPQCQWKAASARITSRGGFTTG